MFDQTQAFFSQRDKGRGCSYGQRFNSKRRGFGLANTFWKDLNASWYSSSAAPRSNNTSDHTKTQVESKWREVIFCQICERPYHTTTKHWNLYDYIKDQDKWPKANIVFTEIKQTPFFADSGATMHMTNNQGILHSLALYNGHDIVYVGDENSLKISHIGASSKYNGLITVKCLGCI